jgi:uncharacterized membrane protein YcaP (DUF421 family)
VDIVLRASAAFAFVFLLLRVLGRRELSTLEPFDLILLVMIGDLVQQGVTQSDMSFTGLVLAVGTFALLAVTTSWLSFRFKAMRKVLEAAPLVVVEHGKPVERNMRQERLTLEEIAAAARLQQIGSLEEVEWAIVENGGQISFIPRAPGD